MPKSSVTPFQYYTFRYDYTSQEEVEKIKDYIMKQIPKYAIFDEVSDVVGKSHIQGKIGKALSGVQLRKHFKAEFPGYFVKSNYSIKEIQDEEKYDSYICKGGVIVCNNVFTDEYIAAQVEKHKQCVTELKQKKEKIINIPFTQQVAKDFKRLYPHDVKDIQWTPYKPSDSDKKRYEDACEKLLGYILKRLGDVAKVFDDNILQRMYNGIKNVFIQEDEECSAFYIKQYKNRINL